MRLILILILFLVVFVGLFAWPSSASAADEKDDATPTIWPAHVTGIIGGLGLATAAAFGSLSINADHSARVAEATLASAGANPGACRADVVRPDLDQMCGLLARHEAARDAHEGAFTAALTVGLTSLAFAVVWYVIAK